MEEKIIAENIKMVYSSLGTHESFYSAERKWIEYVQKDYTVNFLHRQICTHKIAGIYSAFSPMKTVEQNKKLVIEFLTSPNQTVNTMGSQIDKAREILNVKGYGKETIPEIKRILNGKKTVNFFLNLSGDNQAVTIDRHMIKLFPSNWSSLTDTRYDILAEEIKKFANIRGSYPSEIQERLWQKLKTVRTLSDIVLYTR